MRPVVPVFLIVLTVPAVLHADEGDDTLRYYLSKSTLVVAAEFEGDLAGISDEIGVLHYLAEVKVLEVLKGERPKKGTLRLTIVRYELSPADRHPAMKKGSRCILFLRPAPKGAIPAWTTADMWFGVQHYCRWMARSLKRLAG